MLEVGAATGSSGKGNDTVAWKAGIQIGEFARRSGCNVETVRYYERIGLIPEPARTGGGYRLYETADVQRLMFARRARELGFTLEEVRSLMGLSTHNARTACAEVRELAANRLAQVRAKIADLQVIEGLLAQAVQRYDENEIPGCPIIKALSDGEVFRAAKTSGRCRTSRRPTSQQMPLAEVF
jgi:MerR family transcriptional regulator, mercuric resistance operon regulatory protein